MDCRIGRIAVDCRDARQLADFYAALMLMPTRYVDSVGLVVIGNDANPTRLAFISTPDAHASTWPDPAFPLQIHLDVPVDDEAAAHELILGMGASRLPHLGGGCPVYADPAGHPFCLCAAPLVATEEIRANSDRMANLERLWVESPRQIHLDLDIDDLDAGETLIRRLGATKLDQPTDNHVVYADPEGHPFCLRRSSPGL